jgi:glycosyltransferase involved in cell wall biosynthesis
MAYKKANALLFPSEWATHSAIEDCHVESRKVHAVPLGANFDEMPSYETAQHRQKSEHCRLLFVGLGWERKGGDIAFETLIHLNKMGIQAELIICGCTPPPDISHPRMRVIPFLNKTDIRQRKELEHLYATSDFLLVPTRRDCFGMVFCEASAFGLPSIGTATGGVTCVVREGENGFTLPYDARGPEYAALIAQIYQDDDLYYKMVHTSRAVFEDRLNWEAWGVTVRKILMDVVAVSSAEKLSLVR